MGHSGSSTCSAGRRRGRAAATALAALLAIGAVAGCRRAAPTAATPTPARPDSEFSDQIDLLQSIQNGTFAKRAGLEDELARANVPPPVRIDFAHGVRVPKKDDAELQGLARELSADKGLKVDILGCSDPSGSESVNLRVSQERAKAVAARLRELGVARSQIGDVVGRGEDCDVKQRLVRVTPALAPGAEVPS